MRPPPHHPPFLRGSVPAELPEECNFRFQLRKLNEELVVELCFFATKSAVEQLTFFKRGPCVSNKAYALTGYPAFP